ncbi:hypothetical protein J3459_015285 [Metarhizium acridum]|nr:hypothetical protein J3459_015285 [Metarhizium acridum]
MTCLSTTTEYIPRPRESLPASIARRKPVAETRRLRRGATPSRLRTRAAPLSSMARPATTTTRASMSPQHLRRASFLEDRRARLADRAAHAEKVRHRAALAKAAPRGPTASEERALAAQQARERNLAEIVANCAEEVRKAKQVAELTKERREQEVAKMRAPNGGAHG